MHATPLYWVDGPWSGGLAISARPRGGDWLADEIDDWQHSGISTVLSLLTPDEEVDLELSNEATEARTHGMTFLSLPIPDRDVPPSRSAFLMRSKSWSAVLPQGKASWSIAGKE